MSFACDLVSVFGSFGSVGRFCDVIQISKLLAFIFLIWFGKPGILAPKRFPNTSFTPPAHFAATKSTAIHSARMT